MSSHRNDESAGGESDHSWAEPVARAGYVAKGVVYVIIGFLAATAGFGGRNDEDPDSLGALQTLLEQPFGKILVALVIAGLAAYAVWRYLQAFADPEKKGTEFKALVLRGYYLVSGVVHSVLVWTGVTLLTGLGSGDAGSSIDQRTAQVMAEPYGRWLIGLAGVAVIGGAVYQLIRAVKIKFRDKMRFDKVGETAATWIERNGRFGLASRGIVFAIIGGALIYAAVTFRPSEAMGLAESLATLREQPYGSWLLLAVALGLVAYGAHQLFKAWLRKIDA